MEASLKETKIFPDVVVPETSQFTMASIIYGALICSVFDILNIGHFIEYLIPITKHEPELSDWEKLCDGISKNLKYIFSR